MPKIILIGGYAQHGKDSTSNILKSNFDNINKKSIILHYGDVLKFVCSKYFKWDGNKDKAGRQILQLVGTNLARKHYPTIWVDIVILFVKALFFDYDYILVADFRFSDEATRWIREGYFPTTIRVNRLNFDNGLTEEQKNHPSETALDNFNFDYVINSESGLNNLKIEVNKIIDKL
jgi:hypothetical protein